MCRYSYYYEGYRTYGSNIPTFAQGAYFPGDEPGERCRLTDEPCRREYCPLEDELSKEEEESEILEEFL